MFGSIWRASSKTTAKVLATTKNHVKRSSNCYSYYSVWAWGTSQNGTIPVPSLKDREAKQIISTPERIDTQTVFHINPESTNKVNEFICGIDNSGVVLSDGTCLVWGANKNGQLGLGHNKSVSVPTLLTPETKDGEKSQVKSLHLGSTFSALVDTNGNLHTFGYGGSAFSGFGWLGHGDGESHLQPKLVESLVEDGCEVKQVQVGDHHLVVLTTEGEFLTGK